MKVVENGEAAFVALPIVRLRPVVSDQDGDDDDGVMMMMNMMMLMVVMMMTIQLFDLLCSPASMRPVDTVVGISAGPPETFDNESKQFARLKY